MSDPSALPLPVPRPLPTMPMEAEAAFYRRYSWCLNAFPTIQEVTEHLSEELNRLPGVRADWRGAEVMANIFLLSCAILDASDDFLFGSSYDFSKLQARIPILRPAVLLFNVCQKAMEKFRTFRLRDIIGWREQWEAALHEFLRVYVAGEPSDESLLDKRTVRLLALLQTELPADLRRQRLKNPAAFRSQDLTGFDVVRMGRKLLAGSISRDRPVLLVGLRTAGSYFAPLLRAFLANEGYGNVSSVTLRPKKGASARELQRIAGAAGKSGLAVIIDEPVNTGSTLAKCVNILRKNGFAPSDIVAVFPVHPSARDWGQSGNFLALPGLRFFPLMPEEYYKHELFLPEKAVDRLQEYFRNRGWREARIVESATAQRLNLHLRSLSEEKFHSRLKRVYEVQLEDSAGQRETRYVLAKGVGWGWWSYHAFLAGEALSGCVPAILGLRDGVLFTEWVAGSQEAESKTNRAHLVSSVASYVATRCKSLRLREDPSPDLRRGGWQLGGELLTELLSRPYGSSAAMALIRHAIRADLSRLHCPVPTLIDGKMRPLEWVQTNSALLKTDFEHHGLGKIELSVTDPAYDLAEALLYFHLSRQEEDDLLRLYANCSGDSGVRERLFLHKLLAGMWAMSGASANLQDPRLAPRHPEFNEQYMSAWNFSMIHTARYCASLCQQPKERKWASPLVMLDIDGVLDRQIFGFPSTTSAGIRAVSLLHTHGIPIAVNTARSPLEVKEYCRAYGFVGGAAEYGSYVWDALNSQERVLISQESLEEMAKLRNALQSYPGIYLNPDYRFCLKVYTYDAGRTVPLPTLFVQDVMADLGLRRLALHQTYTDSTIIAQEVDKGIGMQALLELAHLNAVETLAIGDSEPDLPMFRQATRCFAPAQVSCRDAARLLGCHIANAPYQVGLLEIVRRIVHAEGSSCEKCRVGRQTWSEDQDPFLTALSVADQRRMKLLLRAIFNRRSLQAFKK